jgi:hypothetical protein
VQLLRRQAGDVGDAIVATAADERVLPLVAGAAGPAGDAVMGHVLDTLPNEALATSASTIAAWRSGRSAADRGRGPHARVGAALADGPGIRRRAGLFTWRRRAFDPAGGSAAMRTTLRELGDRQPEEGPTVDVLRRVTTAPDAAQAIVEAAA